MEFRDVKQVMWCCRPAGAPASISTGSKVAAVVADLSETTFDTPDGDIV